jgi:hypothetical protein
MCGEQRETAEHFLLDCPKFTHERWPLLSRTNRTRPAITDLLSNKKTIIPLINYINATERFSGQDDRHQAFPRPDTQAQGQDQDRSSEPNH